MNDFLESLSTLHPQGGKGSILLDWITLSESHSCHVADLGFPPSLPSEPMLFPLLPGVKILYVWRLACLRQDDCVQLHRLCTVKRHQAEGTKSFLQFVHPEDVPFSTCLVGALSRNRKPASEAERKTVSGSTPWDEAGRS